VSEWPVSGVALVHRNLALYLPGVDFDVTIVTPAQAAVLTSAAVDVTWTFSPGVQATFRVEALLAGVVVYDSGIVSTATQAHTIPEGFLETGNAYVIRVTVTTTDLNTGQGEVNVTTAFAPSVNVTGLVLEALGDKCDLPANGGLELPGIKVSWAEVVPGAGETFVRYSVWRRDAGQSDTDYVRIASITAVATVTFTDRCVTPYTTHEYAVTWTALDGADTLVSIKQDPPPFERVENDFVYVHPEDDPATFFTFFSLRSSQEVEQQHREVPLWGRQQPTEFVGEQEFSRLRLEGLPDLHRGALWDALTAVVALQRTAGSVLCVRVGFAGQRFFMNTTRQSRENAQKTYEPRLDLVEVFFDESVA